MSKLLQQKWNKYSFRKHKEKVLAQSSTLDQVEPLKYSHLQINLKQIQKKEERQSIVDYQNHILLQKITNILKSRSKIDNWNNFESTTLKILHRSHQLKNENKVQKINKKIAVNLSMAKSFYPVSSLVEDFNRHNYYIALSQSSTKDFDGNASKQKVRNNGSLQKSRLSNVHKKRNPPLKSKVELDANLLYKVSNNLERPDEILIKTLAKKDLNHRLSVAEKFAELYHTNLKQALLKSLDEGYHVLIEVLLENSLEENVKLIHQALQNGDVIFLLDTCLRLNDDGLAKLRQIYHKYFGIELTRDVDKFVSDTDIANLLLFLLEGLQRRDALDETRAVVDAKQLAVGDIYLAGSELLSKNGLIASSLRFGSAQICALERAYQQECDLSLSHLIGKNYNDKVLQVFDEIMDSLMHNKVIDKQVLFLRDRMIRDDAHFLRRLLELHEMGVINAVCRAYQKKYRVALPDDIIYRCVGCAVAVAVELCKQAKSEMPRTINAKASTSSRPNIFRAKHRVRIQGPLMKSKDEVDKSYSSHRQSASASVNLSKQVKLMYRALHGDLPFSGLNNSHVRLILMFSSATDRVRLHESYQRAYAADLVDDLARCDVESVVMKELSKALFLADKSYALNLIQNAITSNSNGRLESAPVLVAMASSTKMLSLNCSRAGSNNHYEAGTNSFRGLLLNLLRNKPISLERESAQECAQRLHLTSCSARLSLDVLRSASLSHLVDSLVLFAQLHNENHLSECIMKHFEDAHHLVRLVAAYQKPSEFLAAEIVGCTDVELVQIICWRLENDLAYIQKLLLQTPDSGIHLSSLIESSGLTTTIRQFLLELIAAKLD